jgi:hypothetical protein
MAGRGVGWNDTRFLEGTNVGRSGWTEHPERDRHPDPSTIRWTGADVQTSTEYVQTASEVAPAVRNASLAKAARVAAHRRGRFRWWEFRARRGFRAANGPPTT